MRQMSIRGGSENRQRLIPKLRNLILRQMNVKGRREDKENRQI